jgi:hypothetical protein
MLSLDASCLSLMEELVCYLSWILIFSLWWNIVGKEGLSCYLVELVRKFLHIVHVSYCFMIIRV